LKRCTLFGTFDALGARLLCTHHNKKERHIKFEINLGNQRKGENENNICHMEKGKSNE
jgi:hypothetical protein